MGVSVIVPVFNNFGLTARCLESLAEHGPAGALQVVVIDGGSTDETPGACPPLGERLFGADFVWLRLTGNPGFAAACNAGARAASGGFLFFLNNDAFVAKGFLPPLLEALRAGPNLAGVGPLLIFPEDGGPRSGRVQHAGIAGSVGPELRHLYELFPADHPAIPRRRRLRAVTAAALLVPARLFAGLGGFCEEFVNGMEDMDFCLRAAAGGGRFSVIPESRATHLANSSPGRFEHEKRNLELLLGRRRRDMPEDLAALVAEDGYEIGFTPWLDLIVRPAPDREAVLDRDYAADPDPARLPGLLAAEPLWEAGYALAAKALAAAGDHQGAARQAFLRTFFRPSLAAWRDYRDVLAAGPAPERAGRAAEVAAGIERALADRAALAVKARTLAARTRDAATRRALEAWEAAASRS